MTRSPRVAVTRMPALSARRRRGCVRDCIRGPFRPTATDEPVRNDGEQPPDG